MQINNGQQPLPEQNLIGSFGHYLAQLFLLSFGKPALLLGPYFILLGILTISRSGFSDPISRISGGFIMLAGISILVATLYSKEGLPSQVAGGLVGARLANLLHHTLGKYGSAILANGIILSGLSLAIRIPLSVFLRQLQRILRNFIEKYIEIFSASDLTMPSSPRPMENKSTPPPIPSANQDNMSFLKKESDSQRPWIERIERLEQEHSKYVENNNSKPMPAQSNPTTTTKFSSLSEHTRKLQERLKNIQTKPIATPNTATPAVTYYFRGYFDTNETRFLFNTLPPVTIPRPEINFETPMSQSLNSNFINLKNIDVRKNFRQQQNNPQNALTASFAKTPLTEKVSSSNISITNLDTQKNHYANNNSKCLKPTLYQKHINSKTREPTHSPITYLKNDFSQSQTNDFNNNEDEVHASMPSSDSLKDNQHHDMDDMANIDSIDIDTNGNTYNDSITDRNAKEQEQDIEKNQQDKVSPLSKKQRFDNDIEKVFNNIKGDFSDYQLSAEILNSPTPIASEDITKETEQVCQKLEKVMQEYGIQAQVVNKQRGPIITLYELKPEAGTKVSRVIALQNEICMNLAVPIVRIIAPIPGKSTIGIEIPNQVREPVLFRQLLPISKGELNIVLGKNIAGKNVYANLTHLPHLLIAGATGAGKSVYLNTLIASLLYSKTPSDVRFIMIDPKMVELKLFEGIPHLLMPVITDVYEASKALRWTIDEMERRYQVLSTLRCRDIRSYNQNKGKEKLPYIVVIIDELSDLMMIAAKDVEDSIIRLTQKARAVGIHLIMATQRPSVDVITALIKANCPARIAFQVAQRTDSRTILDSNGAENLLGKGDLLYKSPQSTSLSRIQAPFLSEKEVEGIVEQTKQFGQTSYVDLEKANNSVDDDSDNNIDEELFKQALDIVLESGKTSTSYIQRRMRIGYNRAANLIEAMEQRGYLSPPLGNKPREILASVNKEV